MLAAQPRTPCGFQQLSLDLHATYSALRPRRMEQDDRPGAAKRVVWDEANLAENAIIQAEFAGVNVPEVRAQRGAARCCAPGRSRNAPG